MSRTEPTMPATLTRIAAIEATRVRLPAPSPHSRAADAYPHASEHIVVRVSESTGASGWGEITPGLDAAPESVTRLWQTLVDDFAPALLNHAWQRPTQVLDAWSELPACPAVQSGLDTACWDLWSQRRGSPLSHSLGGTRTAVTAGTTIRRMPTVEGLVREVNRQVGHGFKRIRLEIEPHWDLIPVRAVQDAYPFLVLQVVCKGRYTETPEHLEALHALDSLGLLAIEEPFAPDDLAAHARLRRELRTPLALDTAIDSLEALEEAIACEAASLLNLRLARMGGLTQARRAHDRAVDAGWQVWCGSDGESGIGRAAVVALASLPGVTLPTEMPGAGERRGRGASLVVPPVRAHDGVVPIPLTEPGAGHSVDEEVLRSFTVSSRTLRLH